MLGLIIIAIIIVLSVLIIKGNRKVFDDAIDGIIYSYK